MSDTWDGRIYHDKAVKEKIKTDLKQMCSAVLCGRSLEIKRDKAGFDVYPSCDSKDKKYCHCKKEYMGYIKPGGYMVFANSEIGIYCRVIEIFAGDEIVIPFTSFYAWTEERSEE